MTAGDSRDRCIDESFGAGCSVGEWTLDYVDQVTDAKLKKELFAIMSEEVESLCNSFDNGSAFDGVIMERDSSFNALTQMRGIDGKNCDSFHAVEAVLRRYNILVLAMFMCVYMKHFL